MISLIMMLLKVIQELMPIEVTVNSIQKQVNVKLILIHALHHVAQKQIRLVLMLTLVANIQVKMLPHFVSLVII